MDNIPKGAYQRQRGQCHSGYGDRNRVRVEFCLWSKRGFITKGQAEVGAKSLATLLKVKGVLGINLS